MGSQQEAQSPWQSWDSCHVFGARERAAIALDPGSRASTTTTTQANAFQQASVAAFARDRQLPEDAVFELAWCIAAGAYAGVEDVCIGVRSPVGQALLRCRLDPVQTVGSLLASLEVIPVAPGDGGQDASASKLADVAASSGLFDTILSIGSDSGYARLLAVDVDPGADSITVHHPSSIGDDSLGRRAAALLSKCIAEIVAHPDACLRDLDILPPADAGQIQAWNSKELGTYDACLHEVIRQRAREAPDAPAVCSWDGDLTHGELDDLSSRLAWRLHRLGVGTGAVVAFLFRKSKWTIVSMLGILKAGAAAVALNHDYPVERSSFILGITEAAVLLVGRDLDGTLPVPDGGIIVHLVVDDGLFLGEPSPSDDDDESGRFVSSTVKPEDVAYIQFTSGSTGQPKGIMLEHRTYLACAVSQHEACGVHRGSRVLQFASHSFDAILIEVLTPLLAGACVCVPSEESRMNDLAAAMRELRATWMGVTPTLARVIGPADVPGLRTLCTWGEAATSDIIDKWADAVELINIYGPSETSAESTWHSFSRGSRNPSHLGRGLGAVNTWVVRVDNRDRLAPVGAVGELVIQGPTVSRGYLRDPERTSASFARRAPWLPAEADPRTYYTGDLVRYTGDGQLEFCGRRDTQVKIRGHRIELGEVECLINRSGVRGAATSVVEVVRPAHRPAHKMLVAFVCEQGDAAAASAAAFASFVAPPSDAAGAVAAEVAAHLRRYLPPLSVPSLYLPLTHVPLTASGKADRRRLRMAVEAMSEEQLSSYAWCSSSDGSDQQGEGTGRPETATQVLMARLWGEVLGIDARTIRLGDSFFWLGGNSILAMKLAVAARREGLPVSVAQVLNHPQLGQLSSTMAEPERRQQQQQQQQQPVSLGAGYAPLSSLSDVFAEEFVEEVVVPRLGVEASEVEDVALATDYQVENVAWSSLATRGGTNYLTFDFSEGLDAGRVREAVERLVAHHQILRTVYFVYKRRVYQVALKRLPVDVVLLLCAETERVGAAVAALVEADSRVPVDVAKAIVKFWLVRDASNDGRVAQLVMRASHLQYDGVTQIRWCKELGLALGGGPEAALLPTASYPAYTHLAARHDEPGALAFWRGLLAGASMTSVARHDGIPWRHVLDGQVEAVVDSAVLRSSPDMTNGTAIKAAWSLVLAEMAGSDDVVFGSVVWGRNAPFPGVEDVAGACIENIPVRVRLEPGMTRLGLLRQVQRQYFEGVSFESFRYRRIVEECTSWRPWERLSTLVEYENLGEETAQFSIDGERSFRVDEVRPPADRHDVTIYSMPIGEGRTFIALDFCKAVVAEAAAQAMLDRMVQHIEAFHDDVEAPVVLEAPETSGLPRIPLSLPPESGPRREEEEEEEEEEVVVVVEDRLRGGGGSGGDGEASRGRETVERAWVYVLGCRRADLDGLWTRRVPFFEVWGNLVGAYGLARWFGDDGGAEVSMEEVLENADMQAQARLVARRGKA